MGRQRRGSTNLQWDRAGHAPELYSTHQGFHSEDNVKACEKDGVKMASMPQRGGQKTPERAAFEKDPEFKKGQRFHTGIEGRISVLFRRSRSRHEALSRRGSRAF